MDSDGRQLYRILGNVLKTLDKMYSVQRVANLNIVIDAIESDLNDVFIDIDYERSRNYLD